MFSVRPAQVAAVATHFESKGIACGRVGEVTAAPQVWLRDGAARAQLWDVATQAFIVARPDSPSRTEPAVPAVVEAAHA